MGLRKYSAARSGENPSQSSLVPAPPFSSLHAILPRLPHSPGAAPPPPPPPLSACLLSRSRRRTERRRHIVRRWRRRTRAAAPSCPRMADVFLAAAAAPLPRLLCDASSSSLLPLQSWRWRPGQAGRRRPGTEKRPGWESVLVAFNLPTRGPDFFYLIPTDTHFCFFRCYFIFCLLQRGCRMTLVCNCTQ